MSKSDCLEEPKYTHKYFCAVVDALEAVKVVAILGFLINLPFLVLAIYYLVLLPYRIAADDFCVYSELLSLLMVVPPFWRAIVFRLVLVGTHLRRSNYYLPFLVSNALTLLVFASLAAVSLVLMLFPHLSDSWKFFLEWSDQLSKPVSEDEAYGLTKSLLVWNVLEVFLCIPLQIVVFRAYRVLKYFEKAYLPLYEE